MICFSFILFYYTQQLPNDFRFPTLLTESQSVQLVFYAYFEHSKKPPLRTPTAVPLVTI